MICCCRVNVPVPGLAVRFPKGKPKFGEIRVSTLGNANIIYIASDSSETLTPDTRFEIAANINLVMKVSSMDNLWLGAVAAGDGLFIFAELERD